MSGYQRIELVERMARKQHRCIWCGQTILVAEKYMYERCVYEGDPQSNHFHMECHDALDDWIAYEGGQAEYSAYDNERPERAPAPAKEGA